MELLERCCVLLFFFFLKLNMFMLFTQPTHRKLKDLVCVNVKAVSTVLKICILPQIRKYDNQYKEFLKVNLGPNPISSIEAESEQNNNMFILTGDSVSNFFLI